MIYQYPVAQAVEQNIGNSGVEKNTHFLLYYPFFNAPREERMAIIQSILHDGLANVGTATIELEIKSMVTEI